MFNRYREVYHRYPAWSFTMSLISVSVGTLLAAHGGADILVLVHPDRVGHHRIPRRGNVINDYFDTRYQIDQQDSPTAKYRPQPSCRGC